MSNISMDIYALSATIYACITGVVPDTATDRRIRDKIVLPSDLGVVIGMDWDDACGSKGIYSGRFCRIPNSLRTFAAMENLYV